MDKKTDDKVIAGGTLIIGMIMFFLGGSGKLSVFTKKGDVGLMILGGIFALVGIGLLVFDYYKKN